MRSANHSLLHGVPCELNHLFVEMGFVYDLCLVLHDIQDDICLVFQVLYVPRFVEIGFAYDPDVGRATHLKQVWQRIMSILLKHNGSDHLKLSRWSSFEYKGEQLSTWGSGCDGLLLNLLYRGWRNRWWSSWIMSPLNGAFLAFQAVFAEYGIDACPADLDAEASSEQGDDGTIEWGQGC